MLIALLAIGHSEITCAPVEYVTVRPPSAQTCQQYLSEFINTTGGYVTNPSATDNCQFCSYRTTDQFLQSNSNIFWSHHWRNFGFMWIYVGFNVRRHFKLSPPYSQLIQCTGICHLCYDLRFPYSRTSQPLSQAIINIYSILRVLSAVVYNLILTLYDVPMSLKCFNASTNDTLYLAR